MCSADGSLALGLLTAWPALWTGREGELLTLGRGRPGPEEPWEMFPSNVGRNGAGAGVRRGPGTPGKGWAHGP